MKRLAQLSTCITILFAGCAETTQTADETSEAAASAASIRNTRVEVGCGMCIYDMPGVMGCELAAVINGQPMLVAGVDVDAHEHGLCSAARQALVSGQVEGDTFAATKLELE